MNRVPDQSVIFMRVGSPTDLIVELQLLLITILFILVFLFGILEHIDTVTLVMLLDAFKSVFRPFEHFEALVDGLA